MITALQVAKAQAHWRRDPNDFVARALGDTLYDKQREILQAASSSRRVSLCGANSTGKDYLAGRLMCWWLHSRYPAKAICLGPTFRQVNDVVWREFRTAFRNARCQLLGEMYQTPRWEMDDQHFAIGFSTDRPYLLQGFHSPNLLVIITEAHAMPVAHTDAVKRLNPALVVMTGNAFTLAGEFYDSHHSARDLWGPFQISAFDTPNVQQRRVVIPGMVTWEDLEERRKEWGEDSALWQASVLGQFPDSLEDAVVSLKLATAAVGRDAEAGPPNVLGVDVARFGEDRTVVCHRRGPVAKLVWKTRGKDTSEIASWVARYVVEWKEKDARDAVRYVVVDDVGVGGGVTDQLRRMNVPVVAFQGGASPSEANKGRYANAVTEAWMLMAKAFQEQRVSIERDEALISQLATRRYAIMHDRRIKVQSKEDMRPSDSMVRTAWRSPDEADALAMTFCGQIVTGGFKVWV